jgi:hypothetical protein
MKIICLLFAFASATLATEPPIRYHLGDDPSWANPAFDDSSWPVAGRVAGYVRLPAPRQQNDGFVWVRQRVTVPSGDAAIWLRITGGWVPGPPEELWVGGRLVGANGKLPPEPRIRIGTTRVLFDLPPDFSGKTEVVARRMWVLPGHRDYNLYLLDFRVGSRDAMRLAALAERDDSLRRDATRNFVQVFQFLLGTLFLIAWRVARERPDAQAFAVFITFNAADSLWTNLAQFIWPGMSIVSYSEADFVLSLISQLAAWSLIWAIFSVRSRFFLYLLMAVQGLLWLLTEYKEAAAQPLPFPVMWQPLESLGWLSFAGAAIVLALAVTRRQSGRDRNVVTVSLLLFYLGGGAVAVGWAPGYTDIAGFRIDWPDFFETVLMATIAWVLFRGVLRTWVERQGLSAEFDAARDMQESLVQRLPATPGFAVETAYRPASQVGGDFYRILPAGDGAILIIVGDVSGKGLKAAMTVSVLVGGIEAIRTRMPGAFLAELNNVAKAHLKSGFVTCCAALMNASGEVRIANAGHLAPYVDGLEWNVEAGLPLGVVRDVEYPESTAEGDRFTFLSDGVLEAANPAHELFGFDRSREISIQPAAEIAKAAQAWGQNDDITVVAVRRTG